MHANWLYFCIQLKFKSDGAVVQTHIDHVYAKFDILTHILSDNGG